MKKLTVLFLSAMTLGLSVSSCSSDDDDKKSASIEGKWEITKAGLIVGGQEALADYENEGGCTIPTMQYNADGKFIDITSEYWDSQCSTYQETGTYKKDGNTLTLKYDDDEAKLDILELTESTLKVKMTYSEEGMSITAVSVYKKK